MDRHPHVLSSLLVGAFMAVYLCVCVCVRSCISSVHKMHVLTEVSCSGCVSDYLCDTVIKWLCVCLCVVELMKCVCDGRGGQVQ